MKKLLSVLFFIVFTSQIFATNNIYLAVNFKNNSISEKNIEKVRFGLDRYLTGNSIIVFHDNIKSNSIIEKSLEYTFDIAAKRGFKFGEPEDCLK